MIRRGVTVGICAVLFLVVGAVYYRYQEKQRHTFHVWFLDVGQGDSSLIQFENGQTMLVDCGPNKKVLSELGKVLPFYIRSIDYVLVTHPDLDHYGGCIDVLKQYEVKQVIDNGRAKPHDTYWQAWDAVMQTEQADIVTIASPTVWMVAEDVLQFFSPDPQFVLDVKSDDDNNHSIVFRLTHGNKRFMFTGDMEKPLEEMLVKKHCKNLETTCPALASDVLKVGHHGSSGSSSDAFVRLINPQTAIISVGKNNRYHHPSLRVVRRLERNSTNVLRTDQLGAILMQ